MPTGGREGQLQTPLREERLIALTVEARFGPCRDFKIGPVIPFQRHRLLSMRLTHIGKDAVEEPVPAIAHGKAIDRP